MTCRSWLELPLLWGKCLGARLAAHAPVHQQQSSFSYRDASVGAHYVPTVGCRLKVDVTPAAVEPRVREPGGAPPLLSDEHLAAMLAGYAPPAPSPPRAFAVKQLNVADPLVCPLRCRPRCVFDTFRHHEALCVFLKVVVLPRCPSN